MVFFRCSTASNNEGCIKTTLDPMYNPTFGLSLSPGVRSLSSNLSIPDLLCVVYRVTTIFVVSFYNIGVCRSGLVFQLQPHLCYQCLLYYDTAILILPGTYTIFELRLFITFHLPQLF